MTRHRAPTNLLRAGARLIPKHQHPPRSFCTAATKHNLSTQNVKKGVPATISPPRSSCRPFSTAAVLRSQGQKSQSESQSPSPATVHTEISPIPSSANGTVATITVSNPTKLNIVNSALFLQLRSAMESVSQSPDLRAIILTGASSPVTKTASFIGGADIREMVAISSPEQARSFISKIHDACTAMRAAPVPVIARIDGLCLGGGLELAASCDLRVATRRSLFGMPEVKVGLPCVVEARLLCDLVGWGRARRMVFLAENVDAATAEKWGLVEQVVEDVEALDATVADWVRRLAEAGPKAIRDQKILNRKWEEGSPDFGIEAGVEAFAATFEDGGQEPHGLMDAFVNRKKVKDA